MKALLTKLLGYITGLPKLIGTIGPNPVFVAAMAHCWFAFSLVTVASHHNHFVYWLTVGLAVLAAAAKEFLFDPKFETGATIKSGLRDFLGYASGIVLAIFARGMGL